MDYKKAFFIVNYNNIFDTFEIEKKPNLSLDILGKSLTSLLLSKSYLSKIIPEYHQLKFLNELLSYSLSKIRG